jgi:hypothetical protein
VTPAAEEPPPAEQQDYSREESEAHRLDRNYSELLQELRVAQTGVQILFAFLLSIAFQQRFAHLHQYQRVLYLVTLASSASAATLLIGPTAIHRHLFRQHRKDEVVDLTAHLAAWGLGCLAVAMSSAVLLIVGVVSGTFIAIVMTIVLAILIVSIWVVLPAVARRKHTDE